MTDIVEKEMYSFEDRLNGEHLTLRPESTAGVVRAVAEHSMLYDGGKRLYYMGPMFRHERPQRGRYRQFHQIGAEALGFPGAEVDAELILLAHALWRELGLQNVRLELNSLGEPEERKAHRAALISYLNNTSMCWMRRRADVCIATRCGFWIPKTLPCSPWWRVHLD